MAMRFTISIALAILFTAGHCECEQAASPPKLYISKGACPFECCSYQKWVANRTVVVVDHPRGRPVAQISKSESVLAITGDVYAHPIPLRLKNNVSDKSIPAGSTVYLLHPVGEGFWRVWFRGKSIEMDPQYAGPGPHYQWWAKVKLQSGRVGWVLLDAHDLSFDHVDSCA